VPSCARLYQAVPSRAKLCQVLPGCAKLCHCVPSSAKLCQAVPGCATFCRDVPGGAKPCQAVPRCARLCHAVPSCAKLCQSVSGCAKLCQAVPMCVRLCQAMPSCARLCQVVLSCAKLCQAVSNACSQCTRTLHLALCNALYTCTVHLARTGAQSKAHCVHTALRALQCVGGPRVRSCPYQSVCPLGCAEGLSGRPPRLRSRSQCIHTLPIRVPTDPWTALRRAKHLQPFAHGASNRQTYPL
jgi:hypothetical protein